MRQLEDAFNHTRDCDLRRLDDSTPHSDFVSLYPGLLTAAITPSTTVGAHCVRRLLAQSFRY